MKWLHLPKDTDIPYFHARAKHGGLDIPPLASKLLLLKRNRILKMKDSEESTIRALARCDQVTKTVAEMGFSKIGLKAWPKKRTPIRNGFMKQLTGRG